MAMSNHIICAGSGHLASQVARQLREKNYEVFHVSSEVEEKAEKRIEHSVLERLRRVFRDAGIQRAKAVFLLHDDDRRNIEMSLVAISLNQQIPIIVSLFNEDLAAHLQATHANLFIRSPARIACRQFVKSLHT